MEWIETENKDHVIEDGKWVKCIVEIRNNSTSEVREYETDSILKNGEKHPSTFIWEDDNYACDCNRELFFRYANDEEVSDEEFDNLECSEKRYSVNLKNKKDGKTYYCEFENKEQ